MGIGEQFFYVPQHPAAACPRGVGVRDAGEDGAVASQVEQAFEYNRHRRASGQGAEFVENGYRAQVVRSRRRCVIPWHHPPGQVCEICG